MKGLRYVSGALLAVLWTSPLYAQGPGGVIRGRVTDAATQQPLSGATVTFGRRGALSLPDGRYTIAGVPAGTDTLRARLLGYSPAVQVVTVGAGDTITADLALTAQAISLSEVVVIGYGEQRAGNVTGAVSQVSEEQFNPGRVIGPAQLIQNKIPGVLVEDNNEPGGGMQIRIRGTTSAQGTNEPLYIIDGMPLGNYSGGGLSAGRDPLAAINPEDIENITVLRDASAAAIYGTNAANGVIIVTTKRGQRPQVEYTGSTSGSSITRTPDMLDAAQFAAAVNQYAPANASQLLNTQTNWYDLVSQGAFGQDHNVSVTGADPNTNWRLSAGYLDQKGVIRGTEVERLSMGVNLEQRLFSDRLDLRANLRGSRVVDQFTPGGVLSNAAQMGPTQPVYDPTSPTGYYNWPGNLLTSADNPVEILGMATDHGTTYRTIGNVQGSYRLPWLGEALRAHVNLGFDLAKANRETFNPSAIHSQTKSGNDGSDSRSNNTQANTAFEMYLNYAAPLNVLPGTIDVTGGYSYSQSRTDNSSYFANGLETDLLGGNGVTSARTVQNFLGVSENLLISFFGRANWNLNDRYLASVSFRRDGSSTFGPANQWGIFPSVSVGWRLSEESFLRDVGSLSDLKLRASWAKVGNVPTNNYVQYATFRLGDAQTQAQFGNQFVSTIRAGAYNEAIAWEETNAYNVGLDFGLLNQRISGSLDWYTRNTSNLIFNVPQAAGTNLSNNVFKNVGEMRNRGIELGLNAVLRDGAPGRGLGWTASFTASHNSNEMISINPSAGTEQLPVGNIAGGVGSYIQVLQLGYPVRSFLVYQHIRDAGGRPIYEDNNGLANGKFTGTPDGFINEQDLYVDINGDSIINFDDRRPFHDPTPKWILGHTSYLTYGRFDLNFTLRAYLGNWTYNNVASNLGTYQELTRGSPYNLHASVLETDFQSPQYFSDYYVEDASFLRMDNLAIGYSFNYRDQPFRVFGSVQNLFTLTGYSGVDPTAYLNGIDNNIYPRSRTFSAGLTVRF